MKKHPISFLGLLVTICIIVVVKSEYDCFCPHPVHLQSAFCSNETDFVIKGRITSGKEDEKVEVDQDGDTYHKMIYRIVITDVFKGRNFLRAGDIVSIYVPLNRCGFDFVKDVFYLITGTGNTTNNLKSEVCDVIHRMNDLTLHQKLSLTHLRYEQSCSTCMNGDKPVCQYDQTLHQECYNKYATCYKKKLKSGSNCDWKYGGNFKKCIKLN